MKPSLMAIIALALAATLPWSNAVEVHVGPLKLSQDESVEVLFNGTKPVFLVLANYSSALFIDSGSSWGERSYGGLRVTLTNRSLGPQHCLVALTSQGPFTVEVFKGADPVATYKCSGNMTLALHIVVEGASLEPRRTFDKSWSLAWRPSWQLIVYAVLAPLFAAAAVLDVRDFKAKRGKVRAEAAAIAIKYALYASIIGAVAIALGSAASAIYGYLTSKTVEVEGGAIMLSITLVGLTGLLYGLARWRGWYDSVDEYE
ncbi:MAG: hypothetical protein DRJ97_00595 [Thermoprotei archaeon]|nr:MAG: hypothetical protein DRJ97_00595 [Thermoprotei archaeon]